MKSLTAEHAPSELSRIAVAAAQGAPDQVHALVRARVFADPLIAGEVLDTGENTLAHADAVCAILKVIGGSEAMQAATYLVYACEHLNKPQEVIAKSFGDKSWSPKSAPKPAISTLVTFRMPGYWPWLVK